MWSVLVFLLGFAVFPESIFAQEEISEGPSETLREVIVSHTDAHGILQLFQMKENGDDSAQLTHSRTGCRMPSVSRDGARLLYVEQVEHSMTIQLADVDGGNARTLVDEGMNLLPSWMPDGRHIVWMKVKRGQAEKDPASNSEIWLMNTETSESRRLFTDPAQTGFNEAMPSVSPDGERLAFVSKRSGTFRVWVSRLDGSHARMISKPIQDVHEAIQLPIEQKVPAWSPDGRWIAHWEGVEMIHMSRFTGVENPDRDQQIAASFHVWVVSADGKERRKVGRGDDPTWSPDGFATRAFPDQERQGPKVMVETASGERELPIVPPGRNWGRFCWVPEL